MKINFNICSLKNLYGYPVKKNISKPFRKLDITCDRFDKISFMSDLKEFIPAQSTEEAIQYGKNSFGIKEYKGFSDSDLDTLNWFNEGLFNLRNIMKKSPFVAPEKIICFATLEGDTMIEADGYKLLFSKRCFDEDIDFMKKEILNSDLTPEEKEKKLSLNLTYLSQLYHTRCDGEFVMKAPYSLVYHEMGHIQHKSNLGSELFRQITKSPKSKLSKTAQDYVNLFNKNKKTVAKKVSEYAGANILEFVAEVFAGLCEGVEYDDKIMELYRKLGGVTF